MAAYGEALPADNASARAAFSAQNAAGGGAFGRCYEELRALAGFQLARERANHTLQPTALVHEAYLRLRDQPDSLNLSRTRFLSLASTMIRRILVDHARQRNAAKRGGLRQRLPVEEVDNCELSEVPIDVLDLDAALEELARLSPRQARVVELRFFSGLSVLEVARSLDVSEGSIKNDWRIARAWLRARLNGSL